MRNFLQKYYIGIDEVGRGPLAGPVAVAALVVDMYDPSFSPDVFKGVKDCKQLLPPERERWGRIIERERARGALEYAISFVSAPVIDRIGINRAISRALTIALRKLSVPPEQSIVLLDGGLKAPREFVFQQTIIRGDEKEYIIALASIVAKVARDNRMKRLSRVYPGYGFEENKGYGTERHYVAIQKQGMSPVHRKTYIKEIPPIYMIPADQTPIIS